MADYGLKISKAGYSATTTTPSELIFNSEWSTLKINAEGSLTLSYTASSGIVTYSFSHGLSYIPPFLAFAELATNKHFPLEQDVRTDSDYCSFTAYSTATTIEFAIAVDAASSVYASNHDFTVYYHVIVDPAS